jgi:hypothetical protein
MTCDKRSEMIDEQQADRRPERRITLIRGSRREVLGRVIASDADGAINRAIVTFEITNHEHQKRFVAQRTWAVMAAVRRAIKIGVDFIYLLCARPPDRWAILCMDFG